MSEIMNQKTIKQYEAALRKAYTGKFIPDLVVGYVRYEALRTLNPNQFTELWERSLNGENFDTLVDKLSASKVELE